jgi:hypothetical protein
MLGYKYRANREDPEIKGLHQDAVSLIKHEIHTSTFDKLNDPFEFYVVEEITKLRHCLERINGSNANDVNKKLLDLGDFSKTIGIYSLSIIKPKQFLFFKSKPKQNCPTNELLWTHYANEHKGFCIEYDINELMGNYISSDTVNEITVKYQLNPPTYQDLNAALKVNKNVRQIENVLQILYGIKSISWKYENELRLLFDESGKKSYHPSALKAVYFGLNMNEKEREFIIEGLNNTDVKFYLMEKINETYQLKPTLIHENKRLIENKLDNSTYKILETTHNHAVENFHVLYNSANLETNILQNFISKFREEHSTKQSNISLYDSESIRHLIGKYPLYGKEKQLFAEHLIAFSSFDAPNFIWMYPDKE